MHSDCYLTPSALYKDIVYHDPMNVHTDTSSWTERCVFTHTASDCPPLLFSSARLRLTGGALCFLTEVFIIIRISPHFPIWKHMFFLALEQRLSHIIASPQEQVFLVSRLPFSLERLLLDQPAASLVAANDKYLPTLHALGNAGLARKSKCSLHAM